MTRSIRAEVLMDFNTFLKLQQEAPNFLKVWETKTEIPAPESSMLV